MVLSADPEQRPQPLAIVGAAAALAISDIPFHHVLGAVRVGMMDGSMANPTYNGGPRIQAEHRSGRHRRGHRDGGSRRQQVSEAEVLGAIEFGHECCKKIAAGDSRIGGAERASRRGSTFRRRSTRRSRSRSPK